MNRAAAIVALVILVTALTWQFPLFHVVPLQKSTSPQQGAEYNARQFAEDYWQAKLQPHLTKAHDAASVLAAIQSDLAQARREFGRTVGLGRSSYYFLRGKGTIVSVENNKVGVALSEGAPAPDLLITTGPVFGNAVRDAPGLLAAGDFANSQHFNELAAALNQLVEERVGRPLAKQAQVGREIHFVGCMEMLGDKATKSLKLIPLQAVVE
jgi:predicted lipoprotein